MSETVRIIRVFVSSPGDVEKERKAMDGVVQRLNREPSIRDRAQVRLWKWEEDAIPEMGPSPQDVINRQTPLFEVYLGIMAGRFGTRTARFGSGTEEEFRCALDRWRQARVPRILFYFSDNPKLSTKPDDADQWPRVCRFRQELRDKGILGTYHGQRGKQSFTAKVEQHLREVIHELLEAAPPEAIAVSANPSKPTVPPEYVAWLQGRCGELELMGLEVNHGSGVRLNHVYTPLVTSSRTIYTRQCLEETPARPFQKREPLPPQLLLGLLNRRSLYASGDPGVGKSTFCRWVTWLTCRGVMPSPDVPTPIGYQETFPESLRGRLPVLVRLRDFWQHLPPAGVRSVGLGGLTQALHRWVDEQTFPGVDGACVASHLEHGSALLMLDGVDEVPPVRAADGEDWYPREMLLTGLAEAVARWTKAGNLVLVTSRPYGLDSRQQQNLGLMPAPILGLDQPLQALLVRRWFVRLKEARDLGLETADTMIDHIHVERGLDDLAVNPLLLTAMCIIYDEGKRLPHDKYLLYDRIVDTVLHRRYPAKERIGPIRGRLAAVAYGMHTGEGLGQHRASPEASALEHEVDRLLQAYHQLDGATDKGLTDTVRVREDLLSQSGLLVSRSDGAASFYHLSLQEFLAAERVFVLQGMERKALADLLFARGPSAGWRNTLAFLFGCLISKFSPHVGVEWLQTMVQRLPLPAVDPSRRGQSDGVWNLAIVLGDCLQILSGREAAVPAELIGFFQRCVFRAIEQEIAVVDRQALAVALGRLGDPRIVLDLRVGTNPDGHLGYVKTPVGTYRVGEVKQDLVIDEPFWLSRYPVTNSQYALFLAEGGYTREEWWSAEGWRWLHEEGITEPALWRNHSFNARNQPVVGVSWWEAEAFCRWAGGRLPSEREWEAAARGPHGRVDPWGDEWEDGICNSRESGLGGTSAVGIFPRDFTSEGISDMAGNVLEWCQDRLEATARVVRGGSWDSNARDCRAANHLGHEPKRRDDRLGFRVAAVPPGGQSRTRQWADVEAKPG